jgi:hypothetical protein
MYHENLTQLQVFCLNGKKLRLCYSYPHSRKKLNKLKSATLLDPWKYWSHGTTAASQTGDREMDGKIQTSFRNFLSLGTEASNRSGKCKL